LTIAIKFDLFKGPSNSKNVLRLKLKYKL